MTKNNGTQLLLSAPPYIWTGRSTGFAMWAVLIALLPVLGTSVYLFGLSALILVFFTCLGAVLTEYLCLLLRGQRWKNEMSSLVTGLLLALSLPPTLPLWMGFLGGVIAISIGKQVFGGTGYNPFNPAIVGRVFLSVSFPAQMTEWIRPFDTVTSATPLAGGTENLWNLAAGTIAGSLGETSAIAILLGGLMLVMLRVIDWRLPVATIIGIILFALAFGENPMFHVLSGALLFGAFFMCTDWVTTPMGRMGRWIFGFGVAFICMVIRVWGNYPEGFSFALLFMNGLTPLINRYDLLFSERRRRTNVRTAMET